MGIIFCLLSFLLLSSHVSCNGDSSTSSSSVTSSSSFRNSNGHRNLKKKDKEKEKEKKDKNTVTEPEIPRSERKYYDFVFGYSTGHVGTTTLSEGKLYGEPEDVVFMHELHYGKKVKDENIFGTEKYLTSTFEDQYNYVKSFYIPFLLKNRKKARTLLDLGHNNLYFCKALIQYLFEETEYKFIFVRVRRQRDEAALSLSYRNPLKPFEDMCSLDEGMVTRFCPFERVDEVILKVKSPDIWGNFSSIQKAFWLTDETEARWQQLLRQFPNLETIEVYWAKAWPGSIEFEASKIARLIGNTNGSIVPFDITWAHMEEHLHAGNISSEASFLRRAAAEDRQYQLQMGYSYLPG